MVAHALVAGIGAATGVEPRVEHVPEQLGDVQATFADISRAREELRWEPRVKLTAGLATVVDWVRANP